MMYTTQVQKHLEVEVREKNPNLYRGFHLPPSKCFAYRGFEHEDGWFQLIQEASNKIEGIIKTMPKKERREHYAMHVVSKNGCLRVYMSLINAEIESVLSDLVTFSLHTCEICGGKGERTNNITRCEEHKDAGNRKFN